MSKIHDWARIYWRNASGEREFFLADDLSEEDVGENVRCVYRNEHGDEVAYRVADPEAEHGEKYEVTFNGEVISDVVLEGWERPDADEDDEEEDELEPGEVELAAFSTRGAAREFSAQWRREYGSPEALGYSQHEEDELLEMEYDEVVEIAQEMGIRSNQSHEDLAAQIAGEAEPELTKDAQEVAA